MSYQDTTEEVLKSVWAMIKLMAVGAFTAAVALASISVQAYVWLFRGPDYELRRELRETRALFDEVARLYNATPLAKDDPPYIAFETAVAGFNGAGLSAPPSMAIIERFLDMVAWLRADDGLLGLPEIDWSEPLGFKEGARIRNYLRRQKHFFGDYEHHLALWQRCLADVIADIAAALPQAAFSELPDAPSNGPAPSLSLEVALVDLIDHPGSIIENVALKLSDHELVRAQLFEETRERFELNLLDASGIPSEARYTSKKTRVFPTETRGLSASKLAETYLRGTAFAGLFDTRLPFEIPLQTRFEHTHVVGGTGHGKTQLLQLLIHHDLLRSMDEGASIVVIDSQGDLIRTISHLTYFDPQADKSLADRFMLIDPNDVEHPACLNMFDVNRERIEGYKPADREMVLNGTIELYEYIFGALLGAELTQRQGVIFRYLARLMIEIPNATVHTFRELMEDGRPFRPYMERLQGTSRSFFLNQFFDPSFNATKKQVLTRLWGVLANATFERMFSHPRNKVDVFDSINSGKILLVNTAKDLLKQEGCEIFGRFFIAMIAQAAIQRATIPLEERRPTFVYIDEAQDYFDENVGHLLNQARKYRVGMVLAHQNLDQLSVALRASIMASTSIKFAGGVNAKDAKAFAQEMRCGPEFVQGMRKRPTSTEFACSVKNITAQAICVSLPLGSVERLSTLGERQYEALIVDNRARYCAPVPEVSPPPIAPASDAMAPPPAAAPPVETVPRPIDTRFREARPKRSPPPSPRPPVRAEAPSPGRGGRQHKYLQQLLTQAAQQRGFRASIEEPISDGGGRVDVAITSDQTAIACEISISSTPEQELQNVRKCLAAGYDSVIVVAAEARRLESLTRTIDREIFAEDRERIALVTPEAAVSLLDAIAAEAEKAEEAIRGYRVKVAHRAIAGPEAEARRRAVAQVIAGSLRQIGKDH